MAVDTNLASALSGDVRSIGRVLTSIEDRTDVGRQRFAELHRSARDPVVALGKIEVVEDTTLDEERQDSE